MFEQRLLSGKLLIDKTKYFRNKRIGVIGDLMLDRYVFGKVERISPEAPIPVININSEQLHPGGAANVANNIAALGGKAELIGIVGDDDAGKKLKRILAKKININGIITDNSWLTIEK